MAENRNIIGQGYGILVALLLSIVFLPPATGQRPPFSERKAVKHVVTSDKAERLVGRVLKRSPIIDGHNDLYFHFFACKSCPRALKDYPLNVRTSGQTDIPRWRKGGVGGQLLNVDTGEPSSDAPAKAYQLLSQIESTYSSDLKVVGTSKVMRSVIRDGKIALLPSLEDSRLLEVDINKVRAFYAMGLRSVTLAYETNQLADGSDDKETHNGVSPLGKEMIHEMNRVGMLVDISHVSAKSMADALAISRAPVIFSHSNARALCDVNRNVPDDVLLKLKKNGGMVMLTMVPYFTTNEFARWMKLGDDYYDLMKTKYPNDQKALSSEMKRWEKETPKPLVTVSDLADHFDHVKKLIGVNHIGIAGDFDGISFTIHGLDDVSSYPKLLIELAQRGWTEKDLSKITGENFLRVFSAVEREATNRGQ
jgi:membrane dipeptidase